MEKTKTSWIDLYKKYGIYIFLVVVCAFFSVAAPNFLSASNLINILRQVSMFGIVVIGVTMVMIGGGMDLSVGGQMAVVGMVVGFLLVKLNLPIPVTALVGILTGIAFGTVNGIVAIKLKIMPIIVTLSTMLILQGVAYLITGGYPITGMPKPFLMLGQGYIGPIPIPVIIFVLFILFGWIVKTGNQRQGRQAQPKSVARVHILPIENNYMLTDKKTGQIAYDNLKCQSDNYRIDPQTGCEKSFQRPESQMEGQHCCHHRHERSSSAQQTGTDTCRCRDFGSKGQIQHAAYHLNHKAKYHKNHG